MKSIATSLFVFLTGCGIFQQPIVAPAPTEYELNSNARIDAAFAQLKEIQKDSRMPVDIDREYREKSFNDRKQLANLRVTPKGPILKEYDKSVFGVGACRMDVALVIADQNKAQGFTKQCYNLLPKAIREPAYLADTEPYLLPDVRIFIRVYPDPIQ